MTNVRKALLFLTVVSLLFLAAPAFADTANMYLSGAGSNVLDGVYVGPYTATINGVSTPVICDDFGDESYIGESWTANTSTFPSLSNVKFTSAPETQKYEEAAYLALELLAAPVNSLQAGELQFALWGVFTPSAITDLTGYNAADGAAAQSYLTGAEANYSTLTSAQLAEFTFYTPNTNDPITCGDGRCAKTPPQEFLAVKTPEPSALLLLSFGLACLFLLSRKQRLLLSLQ
jgi:PEP-CTERM motif